MSNDCIYKEAVVCKDILDKDIHLSNGYHVYGDIKSLESSLTRLCELIDNKYLSICLNLRQHMNEYNSNKVFHIAAIEAIVNCLIALEEPLYLNHRKVFISHSSKDKDTMEKFTDFILQLGIGLSHVDIFCTSIEEMGIKNGEDIRRHIKENVQVADFSFLMISKHYKESGICLNEMGAVWAADNHVRYYLLPDVDFNEIGWLCDTNKADKLGDSIVLDAIEEELTGYYGLPHKGLIWSRQRENFIDYLASGKK